VQRREARHGACRGAPLGKALCRASAEEEAAGRTDVRSPARWSGRAA
jgi:hypothetical protein